MTGSHLYILYSDRVGMIPKDSLISDTFGMNPKSSLKSEANVFFKSKELKPTFFKSKELKLMGFGFNFLGS